MAFKQKTFKTETEIQTGHHINKSLGLLVPRLAVLELIEWNGTLHPYSFRRLFIAMVELLYLFTLGFTVVIQQFFSNALVFWLVFSRSFPAIPYPLKPPTYSPTQFYATFLKIDHLFFSFTYHSKMRTEKRKWFAIWHINIV